MVVDGGDAVDGGEALEVARVVDTGEVVDADSVVEDEAVVEDGIIFVKVEPEDEGEVVEGDEELGALQPFRVKRRMPPMADAACLIKSLRDSPT